MQHHVSKAKCFISTIKEQVRGVIWIFPFENIPHRLKIVWWYFGLMHFLQGLEYRPSSPRKSCWRDGSLITRTIVECCRSYCKVHDEPITSNSMIPCMHECIACRGPTGNFQEGGIKFYCLNTGQILTRQSFTEIAMLTSIVARVKRFGAWSTRAPMIGLSFCGLEQTTLRVD